MIQKESYILLVQATQSSHRGVRTLPCLTLILLAMRTI